MKHAHFHASILIITAACLVLFLNGCMELLRGQFGDESGLIFSHKRHGDRVPECVSCHKIDKEEITRASHPACVQCHVIDEADPGSEKCLLCHFRKDGQIVPSRPDRRPNYAVAPPQHGIHAEEKIGCRECHGEVTKARRLSAIDFIRMEGCVGCHYKGKTVADIEQCLLCHGQMTRSKKPSTHASPAWNGTLHGRSSQIEPFICSRCHNQNYCDQCHRVAPPKDHTSVFKLRGHGMHAVSNPNRCDTCHKQDFCIRCHTTTPPKYHTTVFKSSRPFLHCGMCHFPLEEGNRCRACHFELKHTLAIATAPPPPSFVDRSQTCFINGTCHPVNQVPIKHLYNTVLGTECIRCH
ncbi:MAG: cytochrome c3 family protein [Deltaproteobacteria bacterium]|nr:cytochrome c3 family protein [Deltaproteobacteria bacterium]